MYGSLSNVFSIIDRTHDKSSRLLGSEIYVLQRMQETGIFHLLELIKLNNKRASFNNFAFI